jgi:hypothetical protein
MDSMRSLNTSLPSPPKQAPEPPEQLLQAFKAAALSVTKLYKTAALDQNRARSEGYQDALDDLLAFLDKEDIGLSDGEGWRIRRWATERLDGRDSISQNMESDDETEKPDQGSSPMLHRTQSVTQLSARTSSPPRAESAPPATSAAQAIPVAPAAPAAPIPEQPPAMQPPTTTFTFRSSQMYPQDAEMTLPDTDLPDSRGQLGETPVLSHTMHGPSASITITRPSRLASRHNNQSSNRHNTRSTSLLGRGAGQKRKINYQDFFDISNIGHGKDGFGGGGKRGKFA